MNLRGKLTLARSVLRSIRYFLGGHIRFPHDRLGYVLETSDGDPFLVYRETALQSAVADAPEEGVVLVFRMHVPHRETGLRLREVLFDPFANVATPFYAGLPGFRRKLWLAGERPGEFLELYEWASAEDADRFVDILQALLDPFDFAGRASFDVVEDDSIDEYIAARSLAWRADSARRQRRMPRQRAGGLAALVAIAAVVVLYAAWKRGTRSDRSPVREKEEHA